MLNQLSKAHSPYLKQHANNPIAWQTWNENTLQVAKTQQKPIFLSIGYSACHWCHVMAHESFEDPEVAKILNEHFINIKVDREERPDLDKLYQTAHYLLSESAGGWPLSVFLEPNSLIPFFSGTYFPPKPYHGLPSFKEILVKIIDFFQNQKQPLNQQNNQMKLALNKIHNNPLNKNLIVNDEPIKQAKINLLQNYDHNQGGFGGPPKFPNPTLLTFLLQDYAQDPKQNETSLMMLLNTLHAMKNGGIYDHLGGGFFRYAIDNEWQIPHFEKMLYDNAALLYLYSYASLLDNEFVNVANATANWLLTTMQSPQHAFYTSLDADSEGEEGHYYTWNAKELEQLLTEEEFCVASLNFGFIDDANFEKKWHFYQRDNLAQVRDKVGKSLAECHALLASAKAKLLQERNNRTLPHRDEKILTAWNCLAIKGFAAAGELLQEPSYIAQAEKTLNFIIENCRHDKQLYACYYDGEAYIHAYLDDYAFLIDAIFNLLQAQWNLDYFNLMLQLADQMIHDFYDEKNGGFYFTDHKHDSNLPRIKPFQDEATAAGNAIACLVLLKIGYLTGNSDYLQIVETTIKAALPNISYMPNAYASFLAVINDYLTPQPLIILRGKPQAMQKKQRAYRKQYLSNAAIFAIAEDEKNLPDYLANKNATHADCVSYICRGTQCISE